MAGRQAEPAVVGAAVLGDIEDPADRLLLEPFADLAWIRPGPTGELRCTQGTVVGELAIEAEAIAEIDREQVEGAGRRLAEAPGQGVAPVRLAGGQLHRRRHRGPPGADRDRSGRRRAARMTIRHRERPFESSAKQAGSDARSAVDGRIGGAILRP